MTGLRTSRQTVHAILLGMAASMLAAGCGGESEASSTAPHTFVGSIAGTDADVAFVFLAGRWVAYTCGGPTSYRELTHWFQGTGQSDQGELTADAEGFHVLAHPSAEDGLDGELTTSAGQRLTFHLAPALEHAAGLFSASNQHCRTGLIVQSHPDGTLRAQGAGCDGQGNRAQVTPVTPLDAIDDQVAVRVEAPKNPQIYQLLRVAPPLE